MKLCHGRGGHRCLPLPPWPGDLALLRHPVERVDSELAACHAIRTQDALVEWRRRGLGRSREALAQLPSPAEGAGVSWRGRDAEKRTPAPRRCAELPKADRLPMALRLPRPGVRARGL